MPESIMPPQLRVHTGKSARLILAQNVATLLYYRNMSLVSGALYNTLFYFFFREHMCPLVIGMNVLVSCIYISCYHSMRYLSRPEYCMMTFQLVNPGHDLNLEGGIGQHIKDVIIITSVSHLLALLSNKFWLTLFVIPVKIVYVFWVKIMMPQCRQNDHEIQQQEPNLH